MTFYIGVDFHARQQTVCYLDTADGELKRTALHHQSDEIRAFYQSFSGEVVGQDMELRSFYYRLLNKKETSRAIVSVARKLLVRSFIMLRDGIDYEEFKARGVEARSARTVHRPLDA